MVDEVTEDICSVFTEMTPVIVALTGWSPERTRAVLFGRRCVHICTSIYRNSRSEGVGRDDARVVLAFSLWTAFVGSLLHRPMF